MTNKKWTYDACKDAASKYSTLKEFRCACPSAYKVAKRNGWIKLFSWLSARKHGYWNYETCYELAKSCKTKSEMKQASNWAYSVARKNGWVKDYTWMRVIDKKPKNYWSNYAHCKKEAAKYSSINEFQKHCSAAAEQARKKGWLGDFFEYKSKPAGYWNNYERCKELALQCTTRTDFSNRNSAAYMWATKNGWIDSFDWLIDERIYNDSKVDCVYAYEFKEFNAVYVGRTLMRRKKKRDYEHRNGKYTDSNGNSHKFYDGVLAFSIDNSCEIPPMLILEENLTIAEGRDKEDFWKKEYKVKGWVIINKAKTGMNSGALGALDRGKWTYDSCKEIALRCSSLSEYKRVNGSAYEVSRMNGWLNDYGWFTDTSELLSIAGKSKERLWTRERCYELALSCKTASEFQSKSSRAYAASKQYGWFSDYTWFVSGFSLIQPLKWTEEACKEIAITCKTKTEFKRKNSSAYASAKKHGWLDNYDWFVDGKTIAREERRMYTYEKCFEIASKYCTSTEYKTANSSAYHVSRVNGWLKDYIWFTNGKKKDRKWTYGSLKQESAKYLHERDFMLGSIIAYRKARDNNYLNDFFNTMKFNFNGYSEISGFEMKINSNISMDGYKYIVFSSAEAQKVIFNFYKEEMQQGQGINVPNVGRSYIEQTGFYELFPKRPSWKKFKNEICPIIIYSFEIKDRVVLLTPLRITENNRVLSNSKGAVLKL